VEGNYLHNLQFRQLPWLFFFSYFNLVNSFKSFRSRYRASKMHHIQQTANVFHFLITCVLS